jgi:choice-of-anchor A domain-containing protein
MNSCRDPIRVVCMSTHRCPKAHFYQSNASWRGLAFAMLSLLAAGAPASVAYATLVGPAEGYGEFILQNATRSMATSQRKIAVGGNADYASMSLAGAESNSTTNIVVGGTLTAKTGTMQGHVVSGGDFSYTTPTVSGNVSSNGAVKFAGNGTVAGNVRYNSTYSPSSTTVLGSVTGAVSTAVPIDFAAAASYLTALSAAQVNASDPSAVQNYSQLDFAGGAGTNFFNVSGTLVQGANGGYNISAPAGATVVINVSGNGFTIPSTGFNFSGGITADRVLWNFYQATSLSISGSMGGSVLAPNAAVATNFGNLSGQIIAQSLTGNISIFASGAGATGFTGDLRPVAVPEAASWALLSTVTALCGVVTWRRRAARAKESGAAGEL